MTARNFTNWSRPERPAVIDPKWEQALVKMMIFRTREKEYQGKSAVEIVGRLERDAADYPYKGGTIWQFLLWSLLRQLPGDIAISELGLNSQLGDETLALGYLYACNEYGFGELIDAPCLAR